MSSNDESKSAKATTHPNSLQQVTEKAVVPNDLEVVDDMATDASYALGPWRAWMTGMFSSLKLHQNLVN